MVAFRGANLLDLEATLTSEFPPGVEENFQRLVSWLADSGLGMAVHLGDALGTLSVQADGHQVRPLLTTQVALLIAGLRWLLGAALAEILGLPTSTN